MRSFVTNLGDGAKVKAGRPLVVRDIAFDGGNGIRAVALSTDGGRVNVIEQSQPLDPLWNPAGYMRNVVETTHVIAV